MTLHINGLMFIRFREVYSANRSNKSTARNDGNREHETYFSVIAFTAADKAKGLMYFLP